MEINYEQKTTPTYRQWVKTGEPVFGDSREVDRVFCNESWKTITFVCPDFKVNVKHANAKDYKDALKRISKILSLPCICQLTPKSKEICTISLNVAGDSHESPGIFETDDYGFSRRRE